MSRLESKVVGTDGKRKPAKIIVISKADALNDLWKKTFYSAPNVEITEI